MVPDRWGSRIRSTTSTTRMSTRYQMSWRSRPVPELAQALNGLPIAALQLVFSALIPLTQAGGEKEHHAHLGHLRGLEAQRAQLQPAGGLVAGAADHQHRHQQQDGRQHDKGRNPPQPLVVEFGGHIHDDQPHHREGGLALEIEGGVVVGDLLHRRSIGGGGQQHDQPDAQQQQHQGQEGQIHRPPGQLLLPGQIPFCNPCHGFPPFDQRKTMGILPLRPGRTFPVRALGTGS